MKSFITLITFAASALAFMPRGLEGRQSSCLSTCTSINEIVQTCLNQDISTQLSCICTEQNLGTLQDCASCAPGDSTIPSASAEQITASVAQVVEGCNAVASVSGLASGSASASASGATSASSVLSEASATSSSAAAATSSIVSSISSRASVASAASASTSPTSGGLKLQVGAAAGVALGAVIKIIF